MWAGLNRQDSYYAMDINSVSSSRTILRIRSVHLKSIGTKIPWKNVSTTLKTTSIIQFILLLITTRLKQVMNKAGWFKDYDLQEVLNGMKTIRTISIQGGRKRYTTELTPFQKKIFGLYHLIA